MKIIHVAAEFAPIATVGGLGQVVTGLSREVQKKGHEVEIFLPFYRWLEKRTEIKEEGTNLFSTVVEGCKIYLVDSPRHFDREHIYGYKDDVPRFLAFSRKTLDILHRQNNSFDLLHLHDWHTSICAALYRGKSLLTIHNMQYQGKCAIKDLDAIGMDGKAFLASDKMQDDNPFFKKSINLLKAGITFANAITTVSPTYAHEILTPKEAYGLQKTINRYKKKLYGILNGIDADLWNPKTDRTLVRNFSHEEKIEDVHIARKENKRSLQKETGLSEKDLPLFAFIGRLVPQKGLELILNAAHFLLKEKAQFLLLGSSPDKKTQTQFEKFYDKHKESSQIYFHFEYDDSLSRKIYSATDFLLVPSRFEPCGLTQLIALKYGAIPIVRKTGGLADTVFDADDPIPEDRRNGYVFGPYKRKAMDEVLGRALDNYHNDPDKISNLIENGMKKDFSWEASAEQYHKLYERLYRSP